MDEYQDRTSTGGNVMDSLPTASLAHLNDEVPSLIEPDAPLEKDNLENRPPIPPLNAVAPNTSSVASTNSHILMDSSDLHHHHHHQDNNPLSASTAAIVDDGIDLNLNLGEEEEDGSETARRHRHIISSPLPPSSFVPGPLREEPTLKEKLVDRERQRRKEAERARLKRQFALMSNGGGLVYDNASTGGGGAPLSTTGAVRENGSVAGTVGEESTHADLEDSVHHNHSHSHQGDQPQQQLGYTMERFLQERDATANARTATNMEEVAEAIAAQTAMGMGMATNTEPEENLSHQGDDDGESISNVIREEAIEGDPNTAGAPDKGVVMERFLNDPVVVVAAPPSAVTMDDDDDGDAQNSQVGNNRPDDVHRSVSFDMELRTAQYNNGEDNIMAGNDRRTDGQRMATLDTIHDQLHLSINDSNASVQVEVAPEDDIREPVSPGGGLSLPSEVAPSSLIDRRVETSLASMGQQSSVSSNDNNMNDDVDTDDEPRVLRLTEAEIQEMSAIEEASIGNAPPSDRDEESLVGELVGEFGNTGDNVDPVGTTFSQGTPTTAMESGSLLSGNQMSAPRSSSAMPNRRGGREDETHNEGNLDDIDRNSIDNMAMSASVSSHLVVSPGASVSGSVVSVTANPPSEIIDRGGAPSVQADDDDDLSNPLLPPVSVGSPSMPRPTSSPPPTVVVAENSNSNNHSNSPNNNNTMGVASLSVDPGSVARGECSNTASIQEELRATHGPPAEEIRNRTMRPGMTSIRRITSMPETTSNGSNMVGTPKFNRTVDEFDFDKHDVPMTPRSLLSDSLRDLPDWTSPSPGTKMTVSPIHRSRHQHAQQNLSLDPLLAVPTMAKSEAEVDTMKSNMGTKVPRKMQDSAFPRTLDSALDRVFSSVQLSSNSIVESKEAELYDRSSHVSKGN